MTDLPILQDLLILLGLALASAWLFSRLRQSPIVGYLVTGLLIGPYGLHLVRGVHEVEVMAELGVILLLFTIGLEFSFSRLLRLKTLMLRCGATQVALTTLLVFAAARAAGIAAPTAWALGMILALSSTAIVLKLLMERGAVDTGHGRMALATLLFQDLCVILFILILPLLGGATQSLTWGNLLRGVALLALLFGFSRYLLQPLLQGVLRTRSAELFRITVLVLVLGTAWVTAAAGLSLALGAFLAGLALAESDYAHQVLADIVPFRDAFLAVFFISIGMLVDLSAVAAHWPALLAAFVLLTLLKVAAATAGGLWARYPLRTALVSGLLLFQVGEFAFVLLRQALGLGLLGPQLYQGTLALVALSLLVTPLFAPYAEALAQLLGRRWSRGESLPAADRERTANLEGHVVIAGYGLSGRNVGRALREMHIPGIHIEANGAVVQQARAAGELIVFGDATAPAVLAGVGIARARALVLAINDPAAIARAIPAARALNPEIYILVRTRFVAELDYLTALGADEVVPDEFEASLQLANFLLRRCGINEGQTLKVLATLRREHYDRLRAPGAAPPNLAGYLSVLDGGRIEFQALPADSPCLGRSLGELEFRSRTGTMVVGIVRRERVHYGPSAKLVLEPGDTLLLLGTAENIQRAQKFLHGHPLTNHPD
jgi:K+:H+ antiporter